MSSIPRSTLAAATENSTLFDNRHGSSASITVGDGTSKTYGGIVDPPIVDSVNGFVYAVSGSASTGTKAVLVQAPVSLASPVAVQIGQGNQCDLHSPTPNNAYFNSITSSGAMMYIGGVNAGTVPQPCSGSSNSTATVALYGLTFNTTTGVIKSPATNTLGLGGGPGYEFAPMTEFFNSTTGNDWLFYSAIQSAQTNVASSEITTGFPTAFTAVTEGIGTSGIIVDNNASSQLSRRPRAFISTPCTRTRPATTTPTQLLPAAAPSS